MVSLTSFRRRWAAALNSSWSLLFWLVLTSGIAFLWPRLVSTSAIGDPFAGSKSLLPLLVVVTMFSLGSLLPRDEVQEVFRRWPAVLLGTGTQYLVMPLAAWTIARLFGLPLGLASGVILTGCVPGAMASNVITLAARGNISYSISLTTTATLLSPLLVPLLLHFLLPANSQSAALDPFSVGTSLLWTVVIPVVAGHLLARSSILYRVTAKMIAPRVANVALLWIIATVVAVNRDQLVGATSMVIGSLLVLNLVGYAAGYGLGYGCRFPVPMRRAVSIEIGMQNAGLGSMLALSVLPAEPTVAIPTAAYTFGCMLTGTILASIWSRY